MSTESPKLSRAQMEFMQVLQGTKFGGRNRRERDGTVMPYLTEKSTIEVLVRLGMVKWVNAGENGYTYNGVVKVEPKAGGAS